MAKKLATGRIKDAVKSQIRKIESSKASVRSSLGRKKRAEPNSGKAAARRKKSLRRQDPDDEDGEIDDRPDDEGRVDALAKRRKGPPARKFQDDWEEDQEVVDEEAAKQEDLLKQLNGVGGFALLDDNDVETLIDVPNRKNLLIVPNSVDDLPPNHKLVRVVQDRPDQYRRFLQFLREGAEPITACLAADLATPKTAKEWFRRGTIEEAGSKDTYFSRFYRDVLRAMAARAVEAQGAISIDDPKFWLRNGPGRMISDMWRDDPSTKSTKNVTVQEHRQVEVSVQRVPDADILSPAAHIIEQEETETRALPFERSDYAAALECLSGIVSQDGGKGLTAALKFQAGEHLSEEEVEDFARGADDQTDETKGSNPKLLTEQLRNAESSPDAP